MLTITRPLLSLFRELEQVDKPLARPQSPTAISQPNIRLHIIPRSPTHYALQYFSSAPSPRTMVTRLEIFRHVRHDQPFWILRPAFEETVSYSRSSFVDQRLKQVITEKVFQHRGSRSWVGLGTGASCPQDRPAGLLREIDRIVRGWSCDVLAAERSSKAEQTHEEEIRTTEDGKQDEPTGQGVVPPATAEELRSASSSPPAPPPQHPHHPQPPQPPRKQANASTAATSKSPPSHPTSPNTSSAHQPRHGPLPRSGQQPQQPGRPHPSIQGSTLAHQLLRQQQQQQQQQQSKPRQPQQPSNPHQQQGPGVQGKNQPRGTNETITLD